MGTQHRVGTTTIAMQFVVNLKSIGANVSYVEANDSGYLRLIAEHYDMKENGNGYCYKGIAFEKLSSKNETVFDFIVYDLGILDNKIIIGITNCDIRIVCVGNKPHEIFYLDKVKEQLVDIKYITIISYSQEHNSEQDDYYYTKSTVDIIRLYNVEIYCSVIKKYLDKI